MRRVFQQHTQWRVSSVGGAMVLVHGRPEVMTRCRRCWLMLVVLCGGAGFWTLHHAGVQHVRLHHTCATSTLLMQPCFMALHACSFCSVIRDVSHQAMSRAEQAGHKHS
jgi:hypothetical protein